MAPLLTKCDLGIPVDQLNMKSYLYNAKGGNLKKQIRFWNLVYFL